MAGLLRRSGGVVMSDMFGAIVGNTVDALGVRSFRSGLHQVVQAGVALGLSGNAIGAELRAQGVGVGRSSLQALIRTLRAQETVGAGAGDVDLGTLPDAGQIREIAEGKAGMIRTQIGITFRQALGDGLYSVEQTTFSVLSHDLITPQAAIDIATDLWTQNAIEYGGMELWGATYKGTIRNTGKPA